MTEQQLSGIDIRRSVMGDEFVDKAMTNMSAFRQPLQDFINDHAWGSVWGRADLCLKTRSLITLAALTALKAPRELAGHVRGALNNGCSVTEIREVLLHCAVYVGVPASAEAFRAAEAVIEAVSHDSTRGEMK
ncbi:carboxymuconolactone decarboxylase family protein [Pseudomonas brassicacearum]|uniref:carboxymuconolactone decarboxylase family protein n=1 Tax=Pseudomonas TaxID=286 RepID=UPI0018E77F1E|nr:MULTISPECIES: carboxymuconolactone decarboxylase family protein [Pseudomonas]MBJ2345236.1 carboxymuconolactone decarboxylase family protein [Pseudomonas canavaninivorans]MBL3541327.1 carboxymuconolactone decarboxylase family protein [Pseudomonas sp. HB05]UVM46848.1 carboxymuconolactone decarboxylase family protein [Pseudomonas brassicacearum]